MRMPGKPNCRRKACTSGVISPRSSAMMGNGPNAVAMAWNKAAPGPGSQRPLTAVGSLAGISQ
jgi:hypothetical protein